MQIVPKISQRNGRRFFRRFRAVFPEAVLAVFVFALSTLPAAGAWRSGLRYGSIPGSSSIVDGVFPAQTNVSSSILHATSGATWGGSTVWVYWGEIYLDGSTYRFGECIDDMTKLTIDGEVVIHDTAWGTPAFGTITRPAGWYGFEVRFQNGGGGAGPYDKPEFGFTSSKGFCYTRGTEEEVGHLNNASTFVLPFDPGDASFFRYDDGLGSGDSLRVSGIPGPLGAVVPPYGVLYELKDGDAIRCEAPEKIIDRGVHYNLKGYALYDVFVSTKERTNTVATGTGPQVDYRHGKTDRELEWRWELAGYEISIMNSVHGAVSAYGGVFSPGETVTVTATPDEGCAFLRWEGDVAEEDRGKTTIVIAADRPKNIVASFRAQNGPTTYYVGMDGSDENTGLSPVAPFATVPFALGKAQKTGDRVVIAAGTYVNSGTLFITNATTVSGAGMGKTILTTPQTGYSSGYRTIYMNNKEARLEGVMVSGGRSPWDYSYKGYCILIDSAGGTVSRCRVTGNRTDVFHISGAVAVCSEDGYLLRSIVDNNHAVTGDTRGAVYLNKGHVENCLIYGNSTKQGGGLYVDSAGFVRNCTIAHNYADGPGGGVYLAWWNDRQVGELRNCLIYGNKAPNHTGLGRSEWAVPREDHMARFESRTLNCLFGDSPVVGTNSITGDPAFVAAASGDYSLLPGSIAIDAGVKYDEAPATDFAGNPRVRNGIVDIGCHEFDTGRFSCGFSVVPTTLFEGESVAFTPVHYGTSPADSLSFTWTLKGEQGQSAVFTGEAPTGPLPEAGWYDATLTVAKGTGEVATLTRPRYIHVAARTNYLAEAGASKPAYPWDSPETAANTLEELVAEVVDGSTVIMGKGSYEVEGEVTIATGASFLGAGIDETVISLSDSAPAVRILVLNHPDVLFEGATLRKGRHNGVYSDYGNGVLVGKQGGTLRRCRVTECKTSSFYHRGAVAVIGAKGLVTHCIIDHNQNGQMGYGGGLCVENGTAENCLIYGNTADGYGGGLYLRTGGVVRNCTIADNVAKDTGGGVFCDISSPKDTARLENVIVAWNSAPNDTGSGRPEWGVDGDKADRKAFFESCLSNCLFTSAAPAGSLQGDPAFSDRAKGDYSLLAGSAAIDAGALYEGMSETDLAGRKRLQNGKVDIGCHEYDTGALSCGFTAEPTVLFEGGEVAFRATVFGVSDSPSIEYAWTLTSKEGKTVSLGGDAPVGVIPEAGWYDVTLEVTDQGAGHHASLTRPSMIHVGAKTSYLAEGGKSTPVYPWKTPATASDDLAKLVAEAIDGSLIRMEAGVFPLTNQISVSSAVSLVGAGIDKTIFVRTNDTMTSRFFYLNHADALLQGVTVKGTKHVGNYGDYGNGIAIGNLGGIVRSCRVTGCQSGSFHHNGSIGSTGTEGLISGCIIDFNTNTIGDVSGGGLALSAGIAENCLVYGNVCEGVGGGVSLSRQAVLRNCTIVGNEAQMTASRGSGGGIFIANWATPHVANCIFSRNRADRVTEKGAGWPEWYISKEEQTNAFFNCLFSGAAVVGTGAVTGDPLFTDPANGDYTIPKNSPAHDAGLFESWMTNAVDLAGAPRVDHKELVDIGCYEAAFVPRGTMLLLR